jgi:hypothetical protein
VQKDVGEALRPDAAAVHLDHVAAADGAVQRAGLTVDPHAAGLDQLVGAAAGGDARPGEERVQSHAGIVARVPCRPS